MQSRYRFAGVLAFASLGCGLLMAVGCPVTRPLRFGQTNLVSDGSQVAAFVDAHLVNPWGVAQLPGGPFWVNDNGAGVSTVYNGAGQPFPVGTPLVVTIPGPLFDLLSSAPTGIVANTVASQGDFGGSSFIFVAEEGTIATWLQADGTTAVQVVDNSSVGNTNPVYKGAALITNSQGNFLLVANFRDARVDVFDRSFVSITLTGSFTDSTLPAGFAPFNVQALNDKVYVAYAKQGTNKKDDVAGAGNGFVSEFNTSGAFLRRIATGGDLNSPWGLAIGPSSWGEFAGALLVGNFGDGSIHAFSLRTVPALLGTLQNANGNDIINPGLWALVPGNGAQGSDPQKIYLTAGGATEATGLFASLERVQ